MLYDAFLPHVLPSVPGCPALVAIDHVRKAARQFCNSTLAWSFEDVVPTGVGLTIYPLAVDDETERVRLLSLRIDGCSYTTVDPLRGRSWSRRHCGGGRYAYLDNPTDLVVYPASDQDNKDIVMQIAVRPSLASTEWPDDLAEYVDDIAHGAIGTLLLLPEAWKDAQMAGYHTGLFNAKCIATSIKVSRGFQSAPRTRMQRFF